MSAAALDQGRLVKLVAWLLLSIVLGACSLLNRPWRKADDFAAGLRCNMSETELKAHSGRFSQLEIRESGAPKRLVARKGNTQVLLWFGESGLAAYQVTWTYPLTNFDAALKTDVCSGQKFVELHVIGNRADAGAVVLLDGQPVGELSSTGTEVLDVPVGTHTLEVKQAGRGIWRANLVYDEDSSGYDRLPIPENGLRLP